MTAIDVLLALALPLAPLAALVLAVLLNRAGEWGVSKMLNRRAQG